MTAGGNGHARRGGMILLGVVLAALLVAALSAPLAQDPGYHRFADARSLFGVPNAANVLSNVAFLAAGLAGLRRLRGAAVDRELHRCFSVFFAGIALTALGSAWYHLVPGNDTLLWDRLPMTLAFMGLAGAVAALYFPAGIARRLLPVLLLAGLASVLYWHWSEQRGSGDLRWYLLVQFLPMLLIPLVLLLNRGRSAWAPVLVSMLLLYAIAKLCEQLDAALYAAGELLSGHTLKHLLAALAAYLPARELARRANQQRSN